jgi:hypothetical protein
MVEPVTGLAIFAGTWLAKKLAKDWANSKKAEQTSGYHAAVFDHGNVLAECTEHQEKARASLGRLGIHRIESMRRVLPHAAGAARLCEDKGLAEAPFRKDGWFGGRSHKSLLGLSASLIAVDIALPDDAPVTAAETLLSTLAAQGAYSAFETLPHHEGADVADMMVSPDQFNDKVMAGVDLLDGHVGRVDDIIGSQDVAKDAAALAQQLDVDAINKVSDGAGHLVSNAAGIAGEHVTGVVAEVGGAMDALGGFIGDFVGPAGWALAGWSLGGTLHASKKIKGQREEVRIQTGQLKERAERAKRIYARGEQLEELNKEVSYKTFKHSWIMKQVGKKRFRGKAGRERDAKRAVLLEKSARSFWDVMHAPLLGKDGDAADTPLPAA